MLEKYKSLKLKPEMQYFIKKLISEKPSKKEYILKTFDSWINLEKKDFPKKSNIKYLKENKHKLCDLPLKWSAEMCEIAKRDLITSNGVVHIRLAPRNKKFMVLIHPTHVAYIITANNIKNLEFPIRKRYFFKNVFEAMIKVINLQKEMDERYFNIK